MIDITRRAALIGLTSFALPARAQPVSTWQISAEKELNEIERRSGGRLGVAVFDSGTGLILRHRAGERFAMCSTFKFLAVACVLARVDAGKEQLDRRVTFGKNDLATYSPLTSAHAGKDGMTVAALCEAAITVSDNTAANLILASFGGPAALTTFARSLGDDVTRLDRIEPALNEAAPGDPRDTTTPAAMLETMRTLLLRDALTQKSREQLIAWLSANKTGGKRLRAGLPADWRIGDKTGSGEHGTANDIGILWPLHRAPIIATVYLTQASVSDDARNDAIAEVGRVIAGEMKH